MVSNEEEEKHVINIIITKPIKWFDGVKETSSFAFCGVRFGSIRIQSHRAHHTTENAFAYRTNGDERKKREKKKQQNELEKAEKS